MIGRDLCKIGWKLSKLYLYVASPTEYPDVVPKSAPLPPALCRTQRLDPECLSAYRHISMKLNGKAKSFIETSGPGSRGQLADESRKCAPFQGQLID